MSGLGLGLTVNLDTVRRAEGEVQVLEWDLVQERFSTLPTPSVERRRTHTV